MTSYYRVSALSMFSVIWNALLQIFVYVHCSEDVYCTYLLLMIFYFVRLYPLNELGTTSLQNFPA